MNHAAQEWLLSRLIRFGADVYMDGQFASLGERLGKVIVANAIESVIAGKHEGRAVTYRQAWERIYGLDLPEIA